MGNGKGNVKKKIGKKGFEIKTSVAIKIEASIWNEGIEKANELGTNLNALIRDIIISLNNNNEKITFETKKINISELLKK